jgi:hypothetical protein
VDSDDAWDGGCSWLFLALDSSLGAVVSCEEDGSGGEAKAVLDSYCVACAGGMVRLEAA